ncbi:MAG TPA: urate hydroxylase PuuD, partial [Elusimicrobiota bacterium]|nr:urate hydroxylase PuuD [Elusimicrobiota bacterium]
MDLFTHTHLLFRWLHVIAGITWIGMLYFFNLVNLPL